MRAFRPGDEVRSLARRTADGAMSYPTTSKPAFAHSRTSCPVPQPGTQTVARLRLGWAARKSTRPGDASPFSQGISLARYRASQSVMLIPLEMLPRHSSISNGNESRFSGLSEETFIRFNRRYMEASENARSTNAPTQDRIRTPPSYRICDGLTEGVVYFAVVFAPWAFGTTERWSIWTMNIACYVLGALFMAKWLIRWRTGYQPVRGNEEKAERLLSRPAGIRSPSEAERGTPNTHSDTGFMGRGILRPGGLTASLATLTV